MPPPMPVHREGARLALPQVMVTLVLFVIVYIVWIQPMLLTHVRWAAETGADERPPPAVLDAARKGRDQALQESWSSNTGTGRWQDTVVRRGDPVIYSLYSWAGANNQYYSMRNAMIIGRLLGRTVCLGDFVQYKFNWARPPSHEEMFDLQRVHENFVRLAPLSACVEAQGLTADGVVIGGPVPGRRGLERWMVPNVTVADTARDVHELAIDHEEWTDGAQIKQYFRERFADAPVIAVIYLFPTLRTPKLQAELTAHLFRAAPLRDAAAEVVEHFFGEQPFAAVHWRWEEAQCKHDNFTRGSCFWMFHHCALIDNGCAIEPPLVRARDAAGHYEHAIRQCMDYAWGRGPTVRVERPFEGIASGVRSFVADRLHVSQVYLATDGLSVNPKQAQWVAEQWKAVTWRDVERAMSAGQLPRLRAFLDEHTHGWFLSSLEQEICSRSQAFIGTSSSTWSTWVHWERARAGTKAEQTMVHMFSSLPPSDMTAAAFDEIVLGDPELHALYEAGFDGRTAQHAAWLPMVHTGCEASVKDTRSRYHYITW